MTEEEKKAIEFIKKEIKNLEEAKIEFSNEIEDKSWLRKNINELDKDIFYKNTLLNLIEKLQKENEELHKEIERQGNSREIEEEYIEKKFISKDKIREAKKYLEYYLIGNLKYENCQNEFKKILKLLEEE